MEAVETTGPRIVAELSIEGWRLRFCSPPHVWVARAGGVEAGVSCEATPESVAKARWEGYDRRWPAADERSLVCGSLFEREALHAFLGERLWPGAGSVVLRALCGEEQPPALRSYEKAVVSSFARYVNLAAVGDAAEPLIAAAYRQHGAAARDLQDLASPVLRVLDRWCAEWRSSQEAVEAVAGAVLGASSLLPAFDPRWESLTRGVKPQRGNGEAGQHREESRGTV